MAPWNLTDRMSSGGLRYFHLPVASDPTGGAARPAVAPATYLIDEGEADGFPHLGVSVEDPPGATTGDGPLAAAIRLHAMGDGSLSYRPQRGAFRQCLILDLSPIWVNVAARVPWFERWIEAKCLPRTVVYDNVDLAHLRELLEATPVSPAPGGRLFYPASVILDDLTKADFIERFLAGEPGHAMWAGRGAVIGRMDRTPGQPAQRRLRLRMFYQDHSDGDPRPMLPRELFNLLFGIDSPEFDDHPLLRAIHAIGTGDVDRIPRSNRMLLRPPLRTHARLVWEAEQELTDVWGQDRGIPGRLLNGLPAFDRTLNYAGWNKCNVFVYEMLVRSGFRVRMWVYKLQAGKVLRYARANHIALEARRTRMTLDRPGLLGLKDTEDADKQPPPWGRRWDEKLFALSAADRGPEINRMMREEGRAFYLVQEYETLDPTDDPSGHIMLLEAVESGPVWFEKDPPPGGRRSGITNIGLLRMRATVLQALGSGAVRAGEVLAPHRSGDEKGNDLLLIEAVPGRDPGSATGYANLCSILNR